MEERDSEFSMNKTKAKQMVAVSADLKTEIQQSVAAALATRAQPEREPKLQQQQPGPRFFPIWNAGRGVGWWLLA